MIWTRPLLPQILAVVILSACAAGHSGVNTSDGGSSSSRQCNEPCVLFQMQVDFTGLDPIQGSFVDNTSGSGWNSCSEFASGGGLGHVVGPGASAAQSILIDGKSLSFLLTLTKDKFHGPGTYSGVLAAGGLGIGQDTFFGTNSTETLNANGSGQASFANMQGGSVTGAQGTESGTVEWTCSK